jgi:cellobiose phosphorylase
MAKLGAVGEYGYFEAIDFTSPDPVSMTPYCLVKSYMTHHQGMNIVSINNFLNDNIMQRRFHAEPIIKATEILLEEKRYSYFISIPKKGYTVNIKKSETQEKAPINRYVNITSPPMPIAHYLCNDKYSVMVTSDGDGFSKFNDMMLYRWRSDVYANTGNYIYIKDKKADKVWSSTFNPTKTIPDDYQVVFSPHQAEFNRRDGEISSNTAVSLSPDHNLEIRKLTLINHGNEEKEIEVTSYLEVVEDSFLAELSHPAFNKLFIESEYIDEYSIFLSKRRGTNKDSMPYLMHMVKYDTKQKIVPEYENNRLAFIGRNKTTANPDAIFESLPFSNNAGFSEDPIMSIRVNVVLKEGEKVNISFITGVCQSRDESIEISKQLSPTYRILDVIEKFRLQSDIELKYLNITGTKLNAFQDLISPIFYTSCYYRGPFENIARNSEDQRFLWRFGISGDNPMLLLVVSAIEEAWLVKDVLKLYEYLRINQIKVDLVILCEGDHGYMQELNDMLSSMTGSFKIYDESRDKPSLFIINTYQMTPAEQDLLYTVAKVVFSAKTGVYFRKLKESSGNT